MRKVREPGYVPTPTEVYKSIAVRTLLAHIAFALAGGMIAYFVSGTAATWGILLGVAVAAFLMSLSLAVMILTEKFPGINDMAAMLGGYLNKIVLLLAIFAALSAYDFFSEMALLLGFSSGVIVALFVDTLTILRTRA